MITHRPSAVELCAGAGGEALGLERAGFQHSLLVEWDRDACATVQTNRPAWNVACENVALFDGRPFRGATLVSGGLPCPPYSVAGLQLGPDDPRDLFGHGLRIVDEIQPDAVMLENVKGLLAPKFSAVRDNMLQTLRRMGYTVDLRLLCARDYGVPQLRPRVILVALRPRFADRFPWPVPGSRPAVPVGGALLDLMSAGGWRGATTWADNANTVAPTLVGESKRHGGADLGPTRARRAWAQLDVDGRSLADAPPQRGFNGIPRLTTRMAARIQGFPDDWTFSGRKTAVYRQIANALPPPVAESVGRQIACAIEARPH